MNMENNEKNPDRRPLRKPIWPWLLLLVVTLCAIYGWNRATELFDEFSRNMPEAMIELFNDLFNDNDRRARPRLDVAIPSEVDIVG